MSLRGEEKMKDCPVLLNEEKRHSRINTAIEKCAENVVIKAIGAKIGMVLVHSDEKYSYFLHGQ